MVRGGGEGASVPPVSTSCADEWIFSTTATNHTGRKPDSSSINTVNNSRGISTCTTATSLQCRGGGGGPRRSGGGAAIGFLHTKITQSPTDSFLISTTAISTWQEPETRENPCHVINESTSFYWTLIHLNMWQIQKLKPESKKLVAKDFVVISGQASATFSDGRKDFS